MEKTNNQNEIKERLIGFLQITALAIWGLAIIIGACTGGSDGSTAGGAFGGFCVGLGIVILNAFIVRIIDDPSRLIYFIICTPIGFLIGLIWGWDEAKLGATIGGLIAFLAIADMLKKK
jgi:hypothetical protein